MQPNQPYQQYPNPPGFPPQNPNPLQQSVPLKKHHTWPLILALVIFILLFMVATGFGLWAFAGRQNYKDNSDKISEKAVTIAVQKEDTKKDNEFLEREKNPLKSYLGPETYGSLNISFPKTWSAYVIQTDRTSNPVDAYFHPNYVPGTQSGTAYALRVQVSSQPYEQEMRLMEGKLKAGKVTISAYAPKNVTGVSGSHVDGEINTGQKDSMILLPLRDKTIKISTESQDFIGDFNNIVLANLKFVP